MDRTQKEKDTAKERDSVNATGSGEWRAIYKKNSNIPTAPNTTAREEGKEKASTARSLYRAKRQEGPKKG